jgi:RNA polymerase sigma-70 factor (ECF subfamily)
MDDRSDQFETHRAHLVGLAYRMLGSVAEAEDAVQDAYLRWHGADRGNVNNPRAFLSKVVTRLCLDRMKSARQRREVYVGPWLPEPLVQDADFVSNPVEHVADDISFALMLALERLSPLERAAFILHDIFELEFDEIATALYRSEATCRQLVRRARAHVAAERPRFTVTPAEGANIAEAFFKASRSGDTAALRDLLADTVLLHTDGGGRKPAALNVIFGAHKVGRYFGGLFRKGKVIRFGRSASQSTGSLVLQPSNGTEHCRPLRLRSQMDVSTRSMSRAIPTSSASLRRSSRIGLWSGFRINADSGASDGQAARRAKRVLQRDVSSVGDAIHTGWGLSRAKPSCRK